MKLIPVLLFVIGAVMVASAIRNDDPRDTIMMAFGQPRKHGKLDGSPQGSIMDIGPNVGGGAGGGRPSQFVNLPGGA